jgi:hypothetical protein
VEVLAAEDGAQLRHPRDSLVAQVPKQTEHVAAVEHARNLRGGRFEVDQMPHLPTHHGVGLGDGPERSRAPGLHVAAAGLAPLTEFRTRCQSSHRFENPSSRSSYL